MNRDSRDSKNYGNLTLGATTELFLQDFDLGDVVSVEFAGKDALRMPVCGEYDDVSPGELVVRVNILEDKVILGVNYGQLGVALNYLESAPEGSEDNYQIVEENFPEQVVIRMLEKGGYADRISIGKLRLSDDRSAYSSLSDEEFCNFRDVVCGCIAPGKLYRSSSPIDSVIGRNKEADDALRTHQIKTVINMSDSEEAAKTYEGYDDTAYSGANIGFMKMNLAYGTKDFNDGIADCLRFVADNEGPYLIHCAYGKDRTGILCAMIEALCGADREEIMDDYVETYDNLFNVVDGKQMPIDESVRESIRENIIANLAYSYGTELTGENLQEKTEEYIRAIGLTDAEIEQIRTNLGAG